MSTGSTRHPTTIAAAAVFPLLILFLSALTIVLAAAAEIDLAPGRLSAWIMGAWGAGGVIGLVMSARYRQPLLFTGNIAGLIFLASLGDDLAFEEMVGGTMVAGIAVLLIGIAGLSARVATLVPSPIIWGLIAGAVTPFVARGLASIGTAPALAGTALVAYLASRRIWGTRIPPVFPAVLAGMAVAAGSGAFGPAPSLDLLSVEVTTPVFSLGGILGVTPVFIALMTLQANIPSVIYLRAQGYEPPERAIDITSGISTVGVSFLGPVGLSVAFIGLPFVASPEAGELRHRHRAVAIASGALIAIGLLATAAAGFASMIPPALMSALAGLAVFDLLVTSLRQATASPLVLGPMFTFAVAVSGVTLWNLGSFFWALLIGTVVSVLLEREAWDRERAGAR